MIKLGIIGTSDIAKKSILPYAKVAGFKVLGVASRDVVSAKRYANHNMIQRYYRDYISMLEDDDIECVYIALPPTEHAKWVITSLSHNKHVLVEKPVCLKSTEYSKIQSLVYNNDIFFMEAIMIRYHPWLPTIKNLIMSEEYGRILSSFVEISMYIPENMKEGYRLKVELGGGVLYDQLAYWICIMQCIIGTDISDISISEIEKMDGIIGAAKVECNIKNCHCTFYCSYNSKFCSDLHLEFEKGKMTVKNFFRASMGKYKVRININADNEDTVISIAPQNYYLNQLNQFAKGIRNRPIDKKEQILECSERIAIFENIISLIK